MSLTDAINTSSSNGTTSTSSTANKSLNLQATDFIKMMITQLQNQDPTEPTKSSDLLAQMSQIGQLQSSTQLQSSLQTLTLQNSLSSAGSMIGKAVTGKDANGADLAGTVTGVKVDSGQINLQLDSGSTMSLSNVLSITSLSGTTTPVKAAA
ncbi:MAG: flagellar hook capping FlgD N-terminal domain-containing protein [Tepidisphaeraceae bacterium]